MKLTAKTAMISTAWLLVLAPSTYLAAAEQQVTVEEFQEFGKLLVGRWKEDVTLIANWPGEASAQGKKLTGYTTFEWIADGNALRWRSVSGTMSLQEVMAYDPVNRVVRAFHVDSGGGCWQAILWKRSESEWNWKLVSGGTADGRAISGAGQWVVQNGGNTVILQGDVSLGEEKLPKLHDVFHRITPHPRDQEARQLVQQHIDRFVDCFQRQDIDGMIDEYLTDGIRVVSVAPLPSQGHDAIRKALAGLFAAESPFGNARLEGEILHARFLTPDVIMAYGVYRVTDSNGKLIRDGKWGDTLQVKDGKAKFVMQSAHIDSLESLSAPAFQSDGKPMVDEKDANVNRVRRSIERFTTSYNNNDVKSLTEEFTEDGVRLVSGLSGVFSGREEISESFGRKWSGEVDISSGTVLKGKVLGVKTISPEFVAANGTWRLFSRDGQLIDGGQWGNVFRIEGDEAKLVLECAGSTLQAE